MTKEKTFCHTGPCGPGERETCCFLCPGHNQCPHELRYMCIDLFTKPQGCPEAGKVML